MGGGPMQQIFGPVQMAGHHLRHAIIVQNRRIVGLQRQRVLIGRLGLADLAELVIGHALRRIEGPVVGLQFDGAAEEGQRIL